MAEKKAPRAKKVLRKKAPAAKKAPAKKVEPVEPVEKVDAGVSDPPALTPDIIPPPGDPAPITPSSTPEARQNRALFENFVNREADRFAQEAREAFIAARLAGQTVTLITE